jgi:hypothetical protein
MHQELSVAAQWNPPIAGVTVFMECRMKTFWHIGVLMFGLAAGAIAQATGAASGRETSTKAGEPIAAAPRLSPGVDDVVKMSEGGVGEGVIVSYVENSGVIYNLDGGQIVYLRDRGVSEPVIEAMLNQRKKYLEQARQAAEARAARPRQTHQQPAAQANTRPAPVYVQPQPAPVYVQPAPSTMHVIPYPGVRYGYYSPHRYSPFYGAPPVQYYFRQHYRVPGHAWAPHSYRASHFFRSHFGVCW